MKQDSSHIDKWDILLDLLENPSKYSETQKDEILGDEEMKDMYRQLVEVRQALASQKKNEEMSLPSIDEEWEKFKEKKSQQAESNAKAKKQAKVVTICSPMRKAAAIVAVLVVSGFALAAIHLAARSYHDSPANEISESQMAVENKDSVLRVAAEVQKTDAANDSVSAKLPLLYENMELQDILKPIAHHFNLQVEYKSESSKHIRLYLQMTEQMSLDGIIELMNHFEKVNVCLEGNILIVE